MGSRLLSFEIHFQKQKLIPKSELPLQSTLGPNAVQRYTKDLYLNTLSFPQYFIFIKLYLIAKSVKK